MKHIARYLQSEQKADMASISLLVILRMTMILICAGWVSLWILKPTELWTKKWKEVEANTAKMVFGYNGLDFITYTFPVIALAMIGFIYLELIPREPMFRNLRSPVATLSNPFIVTSYTGILTVAEMLVVCLFVLLLAWTFYSHISNDLNKMVPVKSLKLNMWQFRFSRVATRCGLLAEACLALLLLPILRTLAVFRLLGIQFEAAVRYHVWLGTAMILFATVHGAGTLFIWGVKHHIQDEIWKWQKTGRIYLAGEIALATGLVIWITSLPQIRRKQFEIFYYTHHLYIVFLVFFLFHAGDRHFYMVFPGIFLYGIDKLLRIVQSRPETCVLSARVFPCEAIELTLPKDPRLKYAPTSVIFMKIPSISRFQWHCFSVSSSSIVDDHTISVIIKAGGWWTSSLYSKVQTELGSNADRMSCIPVAIEGPYGPASLNFLRYESLLLVAGGSGITPFLGILQEVGCAQSRGRNRLPADIKIIYVTKKSQDVSLLQPVLHLLLNKSAQQFHLKVEVFVTQEQRSGSTFSEVMNELAPAERMNFDTKCSKYPIYGVESSLWMTVIVGCSSIIFLFLLCFFSTAFLHPDKKGKKQKTPSSMTDFFLICSFAIAITCSTLVAILLRWCRLKKEHPPVSQKPGEETKPPSSVEIGHVFEDCEIHFTGRPKFRDIFSKLARETGRSEIGVLVCGPETMKESVASLCKLSSPLIKTATQREKPHFSYHSLTFSL